MSPAAYVVAPAAERRPDGRSRRGSGLVPPRVRRAWRRWRELEVLHPEPEAPAPRGVRLALAWAALAVLVGTGVAAATGWSPGITAGAALVLGFGAGVAPALAMGPLGTSALVLSTVAVSWSTSLLIGLAMARTGVWQPGPAIAALAAVHAVALAVRLPHELRRQVRPRFAAARPDRASAAVALAAVLGLALTVLDASGRRSTPVPGGLLTVVGPLWWSGAALLVAAAATATAARRHPAVPVVLLTLPVVVSQALVYGAPTVVAAARHVGVIEYIRTFHVLDPDADIFQGWASLFAAAAWWADLGRVSEPLTTVATWWPVPTTAVLVVAVRVVAGRLGLPPARAWWAGGLFVLTNTLNVTYFSPQSTGLVLALVVVALALPGPGPEGRTGHQLVLLLVAVACGVTHQLSPYLISLALLVLFGFRLVRTAWPVVALLVPALYWALLNGTQTGRYLSLDALGRVLANIQPPSQSFEGGFATPLITRLTFQLPAAVLVVLGLVALLAWRQHRDRRAWALLAAAASPFSMALALDYGAEGIFRIVLFCLPWLVLLALTARRPARVPRPVALAAVAAGGIAVVGVNALGLTGMDWARVIRPDTARQVAALERAAPAGSILSTLASGAAVPARTTERYPELVVDIAGVEGEGSVLPREPASAEEASAAVTELAQEMRGRGAPAVFLTVADESAAYDERYGIQHVADFDVLAGAIAASPDWVVWSTAPGSVVYQLTGTPAGTVPGGTA